MDNMIDEKEMDEIDKLYEVYGFSKESSYNNLNVYIYDQGYFNNAEIVKFDGYDENELIKIKDDYGRAGYSVSEKKGGNLAVLERELFSGFFKIAGSNNRVAHDYDEFCNIQTRRNGGTGYSYISSKFMINGNLSNDKITQKIYEIMNLDGAQLIILEAPAGFGKTCTSYEVSKLIAKDENETIPILAELSKNRTAKIFNYVLFSEIDRKFSQLSSKLVSTQIVKGKIPLIIDGFDELMSKGATKDNENAEDAMSMLDTVASLFGKNSNAKILLTARKSSIFVGETFEDWVNNRVECCRVNRLQILTPTISDWIGDEKNALIKDTGVELKSISNPVLLSVLKSLSSDEYKKRFHVRGDVLEYYIEIVLGRERERQQLLMSVDDQRTILRKLAAMMVQLDIIADEPDGIKSLVEDIISSRVDVYIDEYRVQEEYAVPTKDEFLTKIIHGAFLDRVKVNTSDIGFINEFMYGIFIGEALVANIIDIDEVTGQYLSFAISAFASERKEAIDQFVDILFKIKKRLTADQKVMIDMNLIHKMSFDYVDEYISNTIYENGFEFSSDHYFYNCVFSECTFRGISINSDLFVGCYFVNCIFSDIEVNGVNMPDEKSWFVSCDDYCGITEIFGKLAANTNIYIEKNELDYERIVLEQFWMSGSGSAGLKKSYRTLFKGVSSHERNDIINAIDRLFDKGILRSLRYCIELNTDKMKEVREILGR